MRAAAVPLCPVFGGRGRRGCFDRPVRVSPPGAGAADAHERQVVVPTRASADSVGRGPTGSRHSEHATAVSLLTSFDSATTCCCSFRHQSISLSATHRWYRHTVSELYTIRAPQSNLQGWPRWVASPTGVPGATRHRGGRIPSHSDAGWSSLVARRAHNPKVAGSNPAPATKYGRFSRLLAYAQAADQHVWSAASVFMGTVCGDLLSPCVCSIGRVARTRAASTLRFRGRGWVGRSVA